MAWDRRIKKEFDAAIGKRGSVAKLSKALWHRKADVRAAAAWSLGEIGAAESIPDLLAATQDPEWLVRRNAIAALGKMKYGAGRLITCLGDPMPQVRAEAAHTVAQVGMVEALPALQNLLDDDQPTRLQKFAGQTVGQVAAQAVARLSSE